MKKSIFDKLVDSRKMPVLFIGSGISKRYMPSYPNWDELIERSFNYVNPDPYFYNQYVERFTREKMSKFEANTKLAAIAENEFNSAFFQHKIKVKIGNPDHPHWVKQGVSPYKMFLVSIFKHLSVSKNLHLQGEMEAFKLLKNRISAVITTNYDTFLEDTIFNDDYTVFCHQNELFSSDSYNIAEIYKIHGSVKDAKSIIITEDDYRDFNESRKLIIAKMLTLFAESPIIFLGYSFSDENIQRIIEEFLGCLTSKELENISEHFIFVTYEKGQKKLVESKRTIFTANKVEIPITEISTDNYLLLYEQLGKITPGIAASRIRETKRIVKRIVDQSISSDPAESTIVGLDDLDDPSLSDKPLAIAIGYKDNIMNQYGYSQIEDNIILEDVLYNNRHLDPDKMCSSRFSSIATTRLIPVFKYVSSCHQPISPDSKLAAYVEARNTEDKIISKTAIKSYHSFPAVETLNDLHARMNEQQTLERKAQVLLKNIHVFDVDTIKKECRALFNLFNNEKITSAAYKRCVMYVDLKENYEKNK